MCRFLDQGEFGEVYQGTAMDILGQGAGPTPVAVKTLKKGASEEEQKKFLSEAALMWYDDLLPPLSLSLSPPLSLPPSPFFPLLLCFYVIFVAIVTSIIRT